MASPAKHQDITIFMIDDDTTPILGSVDIDGNITDPTFSTDPEHDRPWMKRIEDIGSSEVDFIMGGSVIGQLSVDIVDIGNDLGDQNAGAMTNLLGTDFGDTALIGVRMVVREDGNILFDGVCGGVSLPKLTTYRLLVRDTRERERGMKLFNKPNVDTCVFPIVGPKNGFGFATEFESPGGYTAVGSPVMAPIRGIVGRFKKAIATPGPGIGVQSGVIVSHDIVDEEYRKWLADIGQAVPDHPSMDPLSSWQDTLSFPNVLVEWSSLIDPDTWHQIGPMKVGALISGRNVFDIRQKTNEKGNYIPNQFYLFVIMLQCSAEEIANGDEPADGALVNVRVVSNVPPSEEIPQYIEEPFGQLLQRCYDGFYTLPGTMTPVRYNEDRMSELAVSTPFAVARITEPADDLREWVQTNVYRPMRLAPIIVDGEVYPLSYELPDEDTPLIELTDENTISADWGHGPSNIINQVIVEYERELVPTNLPRFNKPRTQKIIIERNRLTEDSQRRHGTQPVTLKCDTLRSVVTEAEAFTRTPNEETGGLVAQQLGEDLLMRFTNGAQVVVSKHKRTTEIDAVREGDWAIGGWSWLPNYLTSVRGFNRLLQVVKVGRNDPTVREFTLVDAGPYNVPLAQPSMGTLVEDADEGSVTIPITDIPEGRAQVQYALGEVEPDANSGQWKTAGYLDEPGSIKTLPFLWPGRLVWARARAVDDGRIRSAWTTPDSIRLTALALIRQATVTVLQEDTDTTNYGHALVQWEPLDGTLGVRILYEIHDTEELPTSLTNSIDFDAENAATVNGQSVPNAAVIPVDTLNPGQYITVQVIGYPGWTGSAVSGSAGAASNWITAFFQPRLNPVPFSQATIAIYPDGSYDIAVDGIEGVESHQYLTDVNTTFPSESSVLATGTIVNGRLLLISGSPGDLEIGDTIFATIIPWSQAGGLGTPGAAIRVNATRHDFGTTKTIFFGPNRLRTVPTAEGTIHGASDWLIPTDGAAETSDQGSLPSRGLDNLQIPSGVELVEFGFSGYSPIANDPVGPPIHGPSSVNMTLYRTDDDGTQHNLGLASIAGNVGWAADSAVLSEDTTNRQYQILVEGSNGYIIGTAPDVAKIASYFITYISTTLAQTL